MSYSINCLEKKNLNKIKSQQKARRMSLEELSQKDEEYLNILEVVGRRVQFAQEASPKIKELVVKKFERLKADYSLDSLASKKIEEACNRVAENIINFSRYCQPRKKKKTAKSVVNIFLDTTERILKFIRSNNHKSNTRKAVKYLSLWGDYINEIGKNRVHNNEVGGYLTFTKEDARWVSRNFIAHEFYDYYGLYS